MAVRYPMPLRPGDRIGVAAPSSGVARALLPRLAVGSTGSRLVQRLG
ncbi:MAG: hypothetical protein LC789_06425 [Actinobacteria bacterium]|nr:hypothetical protein [Actinomycetota bacterium]